MSNEGTAPGTELASTPPAGAASADPRRELALLTAALRRQVVRARRRGRRCVAAVIEPVAPDPTAAWEDLRAEVAGCQACELARTRTQTVFCDGQPPARVLFVGEAPGFHEDQQGVPFVGKAGALLTDIVEKGMGLRRAEVAIVNTLKCRPPENRDPTPDEKQACAPFLLRQIELVNPELIIALGRHAAGYLLKSEASMGQMRGRIHRPEGLGGRPVLATYHPAFLLRSPHMKKATWEDIQLAMAELGLKPPGRR